MGGSFEVDFNSSVKMLFVGAQVTSDTGLLAGRELDERLGLTDMAAGKLWARRSRSNIQHTLQGLLRQSVYARIAGYEDTNDADQRQFEATGNRTRVRFDLPPQTLSTLRVRRAQ